MLNTISQVGRHSWRSIIRDVNRLYCKLIDYAARDLASSLPPLKPHQSLAQHLQPFAALIATHEPALIIAYSKLIEKARYAEREPSEQDYELCLILAARLSQMYVTVTTCWVPRTKLSDVLCIIDLHFSSVNWGYRANPLETTLIFKNQKHSHGHRRHLLVRRSPFRDTT